MTFTVEEAAGSVLTSGRCGVIPSCSRFATDVRDLWVDMRTTFDVDYGKSVPNTTNPFPSIGLLQDSKVIFHLDNAQFYAFYVDLLTRPVPVKFHRFPWDFGH